MAERTDNVGGGIPPINQDNPTEEVGNVIHLENGTISTPAASPPPPPPAAAASMEVDGAAGKSLIGSDGCLYHSNQRCQLEWGLNLLDKKQPASKPIPIPSSFQLKPSHQRQKLHQSSSSSSSSSSSLFKDKAIIKAAICTCNGHAPFIPLDKLLPEPSHPTSSSFSPSYPSEAAATPPATPPPDTTTPPLSKTDAVTKLAGQIISKRNLLPEETEKKLMEAFGIKRPKDSQEMHESKVRFLAIFARFVLGTFGDPWGFDPDYLKEKELKQQKGKEERKVKKDLERGVIRKTFTITGMTSHQLHNFAFQDLGQSGVFIFTKPEGEGEGEGENVEEKEGNEERDAGASTLQPEQQKKKEPKLMVTITVDPQSSRIQPDLPNHINMTGGRKRSRGFPTPPPPLPKPKKEKKEKTEVSEEELQSRKALADSVHDLLMAQAKVCQANSQLISITKKKTNQNQPKDFGFALDHKNKKICWDN